MAVIRWTPGQSHLVDALTLDNQEIAMSFDKVLTSEFREHLDTSYAVTIDVFVTRDGFETGHHAHWSNNRKAPAAILAYSKETRFATQIERPLRHVARLPHLTQLPIIYTQNYSHQRGPRDKTM